MEQMDDYMMRYGMNVIGQIKVIKIKNEVSLIIIDGLKYLKVYKTLYINSFII